MKTFYDCMPCFIQQTLDVSRLSSPGEDKLHGQILKRVMLEALDFEMTLPPPVVARGIHKIIKEMTGNIDSYKPVKDKFNKEALGLYKNMKRFIDESDKPFETAVKLAIAGNIIDFGHRSVSEDLNLLESVKFVLSQTPFIDHTKQLYEEINKAQRILYLADNTGEIVFDKAFIEFLMPKNIVVAVRKSPIINDANYEDAEFVGLTDLVKVIDNGADVPGTYLPYCSEEFKREFLQADLIISKGQGNYETLNVEKGNIFFLLKAKCICVAKDIGCKLNDIVIIGDRNV